MPRPPTAAALHAPTLYAHAEDEGEGGEEEQWASSVRQTQSSGISTPTASRSKYRGKSTSFSTPSGPSTSPSDAPAPSRMSLYSKFVKRFKETDYSEESARDDPDSHYFQRGLGQLVDNGDSEDEDASRGPSSSGMDFNERFSPSAEPQPLENVTPQERERLEWQIMLSSVLDGDVLKSEKTRIAVALEASVEHNRQLDIWLGVRSRLRRRTESEERKRVAERRLRTVDPIVNEILSFCLDDGDDEDSASRDTTTTSLVEGVLNRIGAVQSLYPSLKAMYADKPSTTDPEFQARCDALIAWHNIDTRLRVQLSVLYKWTGSPTLDVTQPNTTSESPGRLEFSGQNGNDRSDPSSFVERVLKEVSLQAAFERGILTTLHTLISQARATLITHAAMFQKMNLPGFEKELVLISGFPSRFMEACLHVRLDYAKKVKDPEVIIIDQLLEDFKVSIGLACTVKKEYSWLLAPVPQSSWNLPPCIPATYDDAILDALRFFFKVIHWKLKSGTRGIYFKETDILEAQTPVFNAVSLVTDEGSLLVAEQIWYVMNNSFICSFLIRLPLAPSRTD